MTRNTPGPNAGEMSPFTKDRRGPLPLTADQRSLAKHLRFNRHWDWPEIAKEIGRSEQEIRHSLANARSASKEPKRRNLNVSPALYEHVKAHQLPGEPIWATMNRLFGI